MKIKIKGKRSLVVTSKVKLQSLKTDYVGISCGRFSNLPPPEDKGG